VSDSLGYEVPRQAAVQAETLAPSRFDLAVLGLRLMGIWLLLQSALWFQSLAQYWEETDYEVRALLMTSVPFLTYLLAGLWFTFFPDALARRLLPRRPAVGEPAGMAGADLQSLAFSAIGLWLIVAALPDLISLMYLAAQEDIPPGGALVEPLVKLLAGLVLFLQGRGLSALWHRLRAGPAGTNHP
jgi:hypothetical protein